MRAVINLAMMTLVVGISGGVSANESGPVSAVPLATPPGITIQTIARRSVSSGQTTIAPGVQVLGDANGMTAYGITGETAEKSGSYEKWRPILVQETIDKATLLAVGNL